MACHTDFDINSGTCGCMFRLGENLKSLNNSIEVDYYTYSNLPKKLDTRIKHCLFPFFVYRHIQCHKKWDIVDATTADTWILAKLAPKNKKPKIVVTSHGLEHMFEEGRGIWEKRTSLRYRCWLPLKLKFVELSLKCADHICVLTHNEKKYISTNFLISQDKISVYYHSLPSYFKNLPDYVSPDEFRILYVGSWLIHKGIQYLLQALEELCQEDINFSVTLGGLKTQEYLVRQQMSRRLNARVKIIPIIENQDLPALYLSHSLLVFPSLYEGFGMVLAEAMACGLPVITTQAGIAREWIKDMVNGIIIPYQDYSSIYKALLWAFNHPEEMKNYGKNAKKLIQEIDRSQTAQQRWMIYQSLIR